MLYFGYVTPIQFIEYLNKQLKSRNSVPDCRIQKGRDKARLIVPTKPDSELAICVSAKDIDLSFGLLVESDFCEIVYSSSAQKYVIASTANWQRVVFRPWDRKKLRNLARSLANKIHQHTYDVQNLEARDCFDPRLRFDDAGKDSPL